MTQKSQYEKSLAQSLRNIINKTKNQGNKLRIGKNNTLPHNVTLLPATEHIQNIRIIEAILFASNKPLTKQDLKKHIPQNADINAIIEHLQENYKNKGINLVKIAGKFCFRTAQDLAFILRKDVTQTKKISQSMREILAIIAYHQPVTRTEIENIRGVTIAKTSLDGLMQTEWIKIAGRKNTIGKPLTYATTEEFLIHFGLNTISDLPNIDELKAMGLINPEYQDRNDQNSENFPKNQQSQNQTKI